MSDPEDRARRVVEVTGLVFPRGLLGDEAEELADALNAGVRDTARLWALRDAVAEALWPVLRAPMEAALRRERSTESAGDAEALEEVTGWAATPDPANPLARALAWRAGVSLAASRRRTLDRLEALAGVLAGSAEADRDDEAREALVRTAGVIAVDLLDLDPDDFEPEIAEFIADDQTPDALRALARATGDQEVRAWAREALARLTAPAPPSALAAVRAVAEGPMPDDPAGDPVWVAAILALAGDALDTAIARGE